MTDATAIILARGGSKGLPRKNLIPVAQRPCIAWTIEAARAARGIGEIAVSTDDDEIASVAKSLGAFVVMRPPELASDTASVDAAARHALRYLESRDNGDRDPIVILYANVPVRPQGLIDAALKRLEQTESDSVQSYTDVGKFNPLWQVRVGPQGEVTPWQGETPFGGVYRRQELPPARIPDGGVIALRRRALLLECENALPGPHAFLGEDHRGIETEPGDVIDIDMERDLYVAEATLQSLQARRAG